MASQPDHHTKYRLVSLEKIAVAPNPVAPTEQWNQWDDDSLQNRGSLPVSYTLRGYLLAPIRVGEPMTVLRTERNGLHTAGVFRSTPVMEIKDENTVETSNSIYRVTFPLPSAKEVL